jgi:transcriptional regulator with XRE-family HTH domain
MGVPSKLTQQKVDEIRRLRSEEGISYGQLAERFGVTKGHIGSVIAGRTWVDTSNNVPLRWVDDATEDGDFWLTRRIDGGWFLNASQRMERFCYRYELRRVAARKSELRRVAQLISNMSRKDAE